MNKLVFATNNAHKLAEVRAILEPEWSIISLGDLNCQDDIPETAETLDGNALLKATYIHDKFGLDCFADDTGLEIEELGGEPGVYSARYAGEDNNSLNNMAKVLALLGNKTNRKARFRTVIALIRDKETLFFEGEGNTTRGRYTASLPQVPRSLRPCACVDTLCSRTGRSPQSLRVLSERSGKACGHKPGMYAVEKSDIGVVPKKESNNGAGMHRRRFLREGR